MSPASATTVKRTTRARKTMLITSDQPVVETSLSPKNLKPMEDAFEKLIITISAAKDEYEILQKQIAEIKEVWDKEQKLHTIKIQERDNQEEVERRREQELYNYETTLKRRQQEDEFAEKKAKWEKELQSQKDAIAKDREELEILRKQVADFEDEKEKAVKEASLNLQKELTAGFATQNKLREQEVKSEKELLVLKLTNLTQENNRQASEISLLKKSLEEATRQLKDVAVKVIESSSNKTSMPVPAES